MLHRWLLHSAIIQTLFLAERLDIVTEEDSIHQLDRAAQVTIFQTENWTLSTPFPPPQTENFPFRRMSMRHRSSNPQPHPAILRRLETPDMAQSGGCPQEALGEWLRHCGRLRTSPYSPDRRSSIPGKAEEDSCRIFWTRDGWISPRRERVPATAGRSFSHIHASGCCAWDSDHLVRATGQLKVAADGVKVERDLANVEGDVKVKADFGSKSNELELTAKATSLETGIL